MFIFELVCRQQFILLSVQHGLAESLGLGINFKINVAVMYNALCVSYKYFQVENTTIIVVKPIVTDFCNNYFLNFFQFLKYAELNLFLQSASHLMFPRPMHQSILPARTKFFLKVFEKLGSCW